MTFLVHGDLTVKLSNGNSMFFPKMSEIPIVSFSGDRLGIKVPNTHGTKIKVRNDTDSFLTFENAEVLSKAEAVLLENGVNVFHVKRPNTVKLLRSDLEKARTVLKGHDIKPEIRIPVSHETPSYLVYEIDSNVVASGLLKNIFHESQMANVYNSLTFKSYKIEDLISESVPLGPLCTYISNFPNVLSEDKIRVPVKQISHLPIAEKVKKLKEEDIADYQVVGYVESITVNESGSRDCVVSPKYLMMESTELLKEYVESMNGKISVLPSGRIRLEEGISKETFKNYVDEPVFEDLGFFFHGESLVEVKKRKQPKLSKLERKRELDMLTKFYDEREIEEKAAHPPRYREDDIEGAEEIPLEESEDREEEGLEVDDVDEEDEGEEEVFSVDELGEDEDETESEDMDEDEEDEEEEGYEYEEDDDEELDEEDEDFSSLIEDENMNEDDDLEEEDHDESEVEYEEDEDEDWEDEEEENKSLLESEFLEDEEEEDESDGKDSDDEEVESSVEDDDEEPLDEEDDATSIIEDENLENVEPVEQEEVEEEKVELAGSFDATADGDVKLSVAKESRLMESALEEKDSDDDDDDLQEKANVNSPPPPVIGHAKLSKISR